MKNWFENETFWSDMYPYMFNLDRLEDEGLQIEQVIKLTGKRDGAVLDLCCGPGRHAVVFAKKGFKVTGVDRTPFLLEKAMKRAEEHEVEIEFVHEDMRSFIRKEAFDLIVNMYTSFGYFDSPGEDLQVLQNMHENLKPEGKMIMDVVGKETLARIYQPTHSEYFPDGALLVQRNEIIDSWMRVKSEWILVKDNKSISHTFYLNIYSARELHDLFLQAGFSKVQIYGALNGEKYGLKASRLIIVASR